MWLCFDVKCLLRQLNQVADGGLDSRADVEIFAVKSGVHPCRGENEGFAYVVDMYKVA